MKKKKAVTVGHAGCHSTCSKLSITGLEEMIGEKVGNSWTVAL
jgi:hypothetical protein